MRRCLAGRVHGRRDRVSTAVVAFTARLASERRQTQPSAFRRHGKRLISQRTQRNVTSVTVGGIVVPYYFRLAAVFPR